MVIKKVRLFCICLVLSGMSQLHAVQDARVSVERALIYADKDMTSPLGYISRGKKIRIGDVPRNKGQVYPIMVGGKIAYIKAEDIATASESPTEKLSGDRLHKMIHKEPPRGSVSVSYLSYTSQIRINQSNGDIVDKNVLNWSGISLKGNTEISDPWDFQLQLNYLNAVKGSERFNMVEIGAGIANRLFEKSRFTLRAEALVFGVPFANYSVSGEFRVNSLGFGAGGGLAAAYRFSENFGIEASAGFHYTKLMAFKAPAPYSSIAPSFIGHRVTLGLNYKF